MCSSDRRPPPAARARTGASLKRRTAVQLKGQPPLPAHPAQGFRIHSGGPPRLAVLSTELVRARESLAAPHQTRAWITALQPEMPTRAQARPRWAQCPPTRPGRKSQAQSPYSSRRLGRSSELHEQQAAGQHRRKRYRGSLRVHSIRAQHMPLCVASPALYAFTTALSTPLDPAALMLSDTPLVAIACRTQAQRQLVCVPDSYGDAHSIEQDGRGALDVVRVGPRYAWSSGH